MTRALLALTLFAACSDATSKTREPIANGAAATIGTFELLDTLSTLAGNTPTSAKLAEWARKVDADPAQIGAFIDEALASDRFASDVIPSLVFGAYVNIRNYFALPPAFTLSRADDGTGAYYLRQPCASTEAVSVKPWWDLATPVFVCPDAYRPERWVVNPGEHAYKTQVPIACDSQVGSPESETSPLCGCGPNLIRCLRDEAQYAEMTRSMMDEVKRTTAYVVQHDLPMSTLFTGNETFRDRNVELYYRRQKIGSLHIANIEAELANLDSWPQEGRWARREELMPGQHAGVLTAPQILHWLPDRRQRQRGYYEIMWCSLRNSFGATTPKVLEINSTGNNVFVHDSWKKLAHTELCTNCHARLDYGFQFFLGYPDSRASSYFQPEVQAAGAGPLYGHDIDDFRGEGALTPLGFATLATSQPDFKTCMTNQVVNYVLGERATTEDVQAIETSIAQQGTFKAAMKVALERWVKTWRVQMHADTLPAAAPVAAAAAAKPGAIVVTPTLRTKLDQYCVDCHDEAPYRDDADAPYVAFTFTPAELPRPLVVRMTEQVAFGMMPKDHPFESPATRDELVNLLLEALWPDPEARVEAARYYRGGERGLPAHQIDNALHAIDQLAGQPSDITWGPIERAIWTDQSTITPGFVATSALEALRACTGVGAKLEDCLHKATSVQALSRVPVPSATRR